MTSDAASHHPSGPWADGIRPAQLVVYERTGWWAAALRREWGTAGPGVRQTRTLDDCTAVLAQSPASFAVVELQRAGIERLIAWLARLGHDFPQARAAAVADRSLAVCELLAREAGAVHFTCSLRQIAPLADIVRRHLAAAPRPHRGLAEQTWAELPWTVEREERS